MAKQKVTRDFGVQGGFSGIRRSKEKAPRIDELMEIVPYPKKGKWMECRPVGNIISVGMHWITVKNKDGEDKQFPKPCRSYDPITQSHDSTKKCPYCDKLPREDERFRFSKTYYVNAIIRSLQEKAPRKKAKPTKKERNTGFKDMSSDTWTPIRVVRIPYSLAGKLSQLVELNRHKVKGKTKAMDLTHPKYGCDVHLSFDKSRPGTDMYNAQIGSKNALTDEERGYLMYDLQNALPEAETLAEAQEEVKRILGQIGEVDGEYEDDDDTVKSAKKGGKKAAPKKGGKKKDEDEDDEDDEDEDEKPAKKGKGGKGKKQVKKAPAKKGGKGKKAAPAKKGGKKATKKAPAKKGAKKGKKK